MSTLFISDLHLCNERPAITRAFFDFMRGKAQSCEALYILGDFFEVWIGDDDDDAYAQSISDELRAFTDSGKALFIMVGNRDFLMGQDFARQCGATLLADPTTIDLYGTPTLLLHGDSLCTRDLEYMAFRKLARSSQWQADLLSKPLAERRAIALQLRQKSKSMSSMKAEDIMDVTESEVTRIMLEHGATRMIHGHTHRPAVHDMVVAEKTAQRMVLGDWGDNIWWIEATASQPPELLQQAL